MASGSSLPSNGAASNTGHTGRIREGPAILTSLRRKILASYLLLVLILTGVGVWAVFNFTHLNGKIQSLTNENYRSTLAAQNMVAALERTDSAMLMLLLGETGRAMEIFQAGEAEFLIWFGRAEDNITLREEAQIINAIRTHHQQFIALWELMRRETTAEARLTYANQALPKFLVLRGLCTELLRVNHEALVLGNAAAATAARWATWSTLGVTGAAAVLAVFLALGLSETIVRPTVRLMESIRRIGEGAPREPLAVTARDEIGRLTEEFNQMILRLRAFEEMNLGQLVTERRKSESIVKAIADPVIVLDRQGRVVMLNPAAEQALNLRETVAQGRYFLEVSDRADLLGHLKGALETGQFAGRSDQPTVMITTKGEERHFAVNAVPLSGVAGSSEGLVAILNDVTWFKKADRLKSEFVSMVSHEFRTPLTSIAMGIGLLQESPLLEEGTRERELLGVVAEESGRLTRLVNELLDLSRMEAGRLEMALGPVEPELLLERATAPFREQAAQQAVTLETAVAPDTPTLSADGDKITWVLTNLVSNALRYTPGGGQITLEAERWGEFARLSVSDTGAGIPPEMQGRIFERFYQVPGRPGGGAGLGLAISKEIVRAHGGRIWVESKPGEGSRFLFTIPTARD